MKSIYSNIRGITLIELVVVMGIMSIMTVFSVMALSSSKNTISLSASIETLGSKVLELKTAILSRRLESVEMVFSLSHPRIYYFTQSLKLSEKQKKELASDLKLSSLTQVSSTNEGSASFQWTNPENNDVLIQARAGKEVILEEKISQPLTVGGIKTLNALNASQKHEFFLLHPLKNISESTITLWYYAPSNLSYQAHVLLSKIDVLDFSGTWRPVQDITMTMKAPFSQKRYISSATEFKKMRLTFNKDGEEIQYEI